MSAAGRLLLTLPRPQYVPLPEAFVSALAWKVYDVDLAGAGGAPIGLRYRGRETTGVTVQRVTAPREDVLGTFGEALQQAGVAGEAAARTLAAAVSNSLEGVRAPKSGTLAVSPITPSVALLQNLRGLLGVRNPPDLGEIIERLFELGATGDPSDSSLSAAARWKHAVDRRVSKDSLLAVIDSAVDATLLDSPRRDRPQRERTASSPLEDPWSTPFGWFHESWAKLTSDVWVDALPARVWVDWATTVLRLGFGIGYLWESLWYETLARAILDTDVSVVSSDIVRHRMPEVLPWRSSRRGPEARDLASLLSWRAYRSDQIRRLFVGWAGDRDDDLPLESACAQMRKDAQLVTALQAALRSNEKPQSGKNLWEACRYALQTRAVAGEATDYYGLLRSHGRYLTPEPGTEWVAVVVSLACGQPGGHTTISEVLNAMDRLGARPELADLIELLERAGLARGSADADQAVIVQSAF